MRPDYSLEVRRHLNDPARLCQLLGLSERMETQAGGVMIRCPEHQERTPSCSVKLRGDGTISVNCFGCGWSGDALTMIANRFGLSLESAFTDVLVEGAKLAGLHQVVDELTGGRAVSDRRPKPPPGPPTPPEPEYPDVAEVKALWDAAVDVTEINHVAAYLHVRKIDPERAAATRTMRALPDGVELPSWAKYRGRTWLETEHRLIMPMLDCNGELRSVRAWRVVVDNTTPKRLPPAGKRAARLVLANIAAWRLLRNDRKPQRIVIVEGEPDFATWATRTDDPVFGIMSGAWHSGFAMRIPPLSQVFIRTDDDTAGHKYAREVAGSLSDDIAVWRAA